MCSVFYAMDFRSFAVDFYRAIQIKLLGTLFLLNTVGGTGRYAPDIWRIFPQFLYLLFFFFLFFRPDNEYCIWRYGYQKDGYSAKHPAGSVKQRPDTFFLLFGRAKSQLLIIAT